MVAGPFVASTLADFGADVIKIEHPRLGDPMRHWAPFKDGIPLTWKVTGRNKRLITLDLSQPRGQELALRLASTADIVVENFRPGTMERWGLDYGTLSQNNKGLILARVSGYGQDGPLGARPGYGTVAEAMSGIPSFTGAQDGPPTLSAFPFADTIAGVFGALGVLMALQERNVSDDHRGQVVDVALYEPLFRLVESQVIGFDQLGIVKQRLGNGIEEDVPRNAYRTSDDHWIAISASSDRTFERLARAVGQPSLAKDVRFTSNRSRIENREAIDEILSAWFAQRSRDDAMSELDRNDVVAGPILNIAEIVEHAQFKARQNIVDVPDRHFGKVRMPGVVPRLSRTPGAVRHSGGELGDDNVQVYLHELGLDEAEFADLRAEGVI